jgi:hypothetical protein
VCVIVCSETFKYPLINNSSAATFLEITSNKLNPRQMIAPERVAERKELGVCGSYQFTAATR